MAETTEVAKPARAGFNQFFVCRACAKAFADRAATEPIEVVGEIALVASSVPHPRYPNDAELATVTWKRAPHVAPDGKPTAIVAKAAAGECCPGHTVLADARHITITKRGDAFEITAAKHLE